MAAVYRTEAVHCAVGKMLAQLYTVAHLCPLQYRFNLSNGGSELEGLGELQVYFSLMGQSD